MRWREAVSPVAMQRVALMAPLEALRDLLVAVADEGTVGLDDGTPGGELRVRGPATAMLLRLHTSDTVAARKSEAAAALGPLAGGAWHPRTAACGDAF